MLKYNQMQIKRIDSSSNSLANILNLEDRNILITEQGEGLLFYDWRILNFEPGNLFFILPLANVQLYGALNKGYVISFKNNFFNSFLETNHNNNEFRLFDDHNCSHDLSEEKATNLYATLDDLSEKGDILPGHSTQVLKNLITLLN